MKKSMIFAVFFSLLGTLNSCGQSPTGYINGHGFVDLGLSVKWATCNIGAKSPEAYGDYFAWGEIEPKSSYDANNCTTYGLYVTGGLNGNVVNISGYADYDAATANWGETWRTPTIDEITELFTSCEINYTRQRWQRGIKLIGPNGNSIFLPEAGRKFGDSITETDEYIFLWTSSTQCGCSVHATCMVVNANDLLISRTSCNENRSVGMCVRAVSF